MTSRAGHRYDVRLAVALAGVVVPSCGGLVLWALSVRSRLPSPVAQHWGLDGKADGFASLGSTLAVTVGVVAVIAVALGPVAVVSRLPDMVRRWLAGIVAFVAVFANVLVWDGLRGQVGLTDPSLAPVSDVGIAVATVLGVLAGAGVAALATPSSIERTASGRPPADAPRLEGVDADLAWESPLPSVSTWAGVLALLVGIGFIGLAAAVSWGLLPIGVIVVGLLAGAGRGRIRIDAEGLRATTLGATFLHVPVEGVAAADVVEVSPFREFGGWGLRVDTTGRIGLVTRAGPAVRVRRGDDSEVVITLDNSHDAAATLNSLADRVQRPN